jgi:hypothetical protein
LRMDDLGGAIPMEEDVLERNRNLNRGFRRARVY